MVPRRSTAKQVAFMDQSRYMPPNELDSTSSRLLRRLDGADPEAWRKLVRLYGPVVRYWIRRAGLNKADLADVFQDVFLAVSKNVGRFDRQEGKAKFRAWLKTITLSKVNDHFRRLKRQQAGVGGTTMVKRLDQLHGGDAPLATDSSSSDEEDSALAGSEDLFIAQRTLQMVKGEFREKTWHAFYRTAVDGQTSSAVADELGMQAAAVRRAKFRVLKRLREALGVDSTADRADKQVL